MHTITHFTNKQSLTSPASAHCHCWHWHSLLGDMVVLRTMAGIFMHTFTSPWALHSSFVWLLWTCESHMIIIMIMSAVAIWLNQQHMMHEGARQVNAHTTYLLSRYACYECLVSANFRSHLSMMCRLLMPAASWAKSLPRCCQLQLLRVCPLPSYADCVQILGCIACISALQLAVETCYWTKKRW